MTDMTTVLIAGAGQAGSEAAWALRSGGFDGRILLVGQETRLPYERPPLSKKFLEGSVTEDRLYLRKARAYDEMGIETLLGSRVVRLDAEGGRAFLADGSDLHFSHCVLALGAAPRRPLFPGLPAEALRVLRDADDSVALSAELVPGRHLAVIGGGYLGLEIAAAAVARGVEVTVLEQAPRLLSRGVSGVTADFFAARHRKAGVSLHLGAAVADVRESGGSKCISLSDGVTLEADAVVAAIGVVPRVEVAEMSGLRCGNGILVDEQCRTSAPNVFALGDCAAQFQAAYGRHVRLESVQAAVTHARIVAAVLLGMPVPPPRPCYFWTDQYDLKLKMAGLPDPSQPTEDVVLGNPADGGFCVQRFQNDVLVAVEAVNKPVGFVRGQASIGKPRSCLPA